MNMIRRLPLAAALAAFAGIAASASAEEISTRALYACAQTEDDAARLECYDAAVGRLKAAEEAGEIATITRAEVEAVERASFGLSIPSLPSIALPKFGGDEDDRGELESVVLAVDRAAPNSAGKIVVTLENGQIWVHLDSERVRYRNVEQAEIRRAALGSFMMTLDGGRAFRARRVR